MSGRCTGIGPALAGGMLPDVEQRENREESDRWEREKSAGWDALDATGVVDLGNGAKYSRVEYEGQWVGINYWHLNPSGNLCGGWIPFVGSAIPGGGTYWDVLSSEPLTLSPSLLCSRCGHHGFIREGRWISV